MREQVRKPKHPWMAAVMIVGIAVVYFTLLGKNQFPEPGPNLLYDSEVYARVDNIETRYEETGRIDLEIKDARAMTTDHEGNIYVTGENTVVLLSPEGSEISRFTVDGTPNSIALAPDGTIFMGMRDHIQVFDVDGTVQAVWEDLGPQAYLTSVAVSDEDVFVADAGNRVVFHFDLDGALLGRIGEADPDRDVPGIVVPSPYFDVAINDEGTLWVVNPGMMGLESYRSNGDFITSWYKPSLKLEGFSGCCNPSHIAFDVDGRLITSDKGLVRIKVYEVTSGEFEELVAGTQDFPNRQALKDLTVDRNNRILALDGVEKAIRIFELKDTADDQTD